MIYILYHDYSRNQSYRSNRPSVAAVQMFGPFDYQHQAQEWVDKELKIDNDHTVSYTFLPSV